MHVAETGKRTASSIITAILLICIGVFLLSVLIGFKPEESPHFAEVVEEQPVHFLGWTGIRIASTCFILLGRASVYFSLMLAYAGYVVLRPIRPIGKTGYIVLAFLSILMLSGLLYPSNQDVLHRGGGLCGRFMTTRLAPRLSDWLLTLYFAIPMIAALYVLFKIPIVMLYNFVMRKEDGEADWQGDQGLVRARFRSNELARDLALRAGQLGVGDFHRPWPERFGG